MTGKTAPTGVEYFFNNDDIIVSKTDLKGRITYANSVFLEIAGYKEKEVMGQPQSLIRHPEMPRCVFKLLWDEISAGNEVFAYVKNMTKNGGYYWVFAHVTPTFDASGSTVSYHSSRRVPKIGVIDNVVSPLYKKLLDEEKKHSNRKDGLKASYNMLLNILEEKGMSYDEFIFSI